MLYLVWIVANATVIGLSIREFGGLGKWFHAVSQTRVHTPVGYYTWLVYGGIFFWGCLFALLSPVAVIVGIGIEFAQIGWLLTKPGTTREAFYIFYPEDVESEDDEDE